MGAMSKEARALRLEVERAVLRAVERLGPSGLDQSAIVKQFAGRTTLYRWISTILASGAPVRHVARQMRRAAERRAKRTPDPEKAAAQAAAEMAAAVPAPVPRVESMVDGARSAVDVVERLNRCITIAEKLIAHAETPEGAVRNARLMLNASEHLRRSLETTVKLHEAIQNISRVDTFVAELLELLNQVARESPQVGELIVRRVRAMGAAWRGATPLN